MTESRAFRVLRRLGALCALTIACGCATRQEVVLVKPSGLRPVSAVAQMPADGNSPEMDVFLKSAIEKQGVALKAITAPGEQKASGVDAVISYVDVWRWDLAMYLQSVVVRLFDAETGDLIVTGTWTDSPFHGFRDARLVMEGLVRDMLERLRTSLKTRPTT